MLTLNTNAWWNWGYSLSNKEVSTAYPQIEDNILLLPKIIWLDSMWYFSPAFEVNWTPVHAVNDTFIAPNNLSCSSSTIYNWSSYLYPPTNIISLQYTSPAIFRYWLFEPLPAWMTIWKTIVLPKARYCQGYWSLWCLYCLRCFYRQCTALLTCW